MRDKIFRLVLSVILALSFAPSVAFAEPGEPDQPTWSSTRVALNNPLTSDAFAPQAFGTGDLADPLSIEEEYSDAVASTVSQTEAIAAIRKAMEERQSSVSVVVKVEVAEQENIGKTMFYAALDEDGNPTHGDCLRSVYETMGCGSIMWSDGTTLCSYEITYKTTADQEAELMAEVEDVLDGLNIDGKTDYEKVLAIYDYICANVEYDYANLEDETHRLKYTAYAALMDGTSVCQGYASLFYLMAGKAGLSTRMISGIGNGGPHAWNIVQLDDGAYYNIDATWDSSRRQAGVDYECFLKSEADFENQARGSVVESGGTIVVDYASDAFAVAYPVAETKDVRSPYEVGVLA